MRFTVTWTTAARDQLAELWLGSQDRDAISLAAAEIDRQLLSKPLETGESRGEALRVVVAAPIAVYFSVRELDRIVTVHAVWRW